MGSGDEVRKGTEETITGGGGDFASGETAAEETAAAAEDVNRCDQSAVRMQHTAVCWLDGRQAGKHEANE